MDDYEGFWAKGKGSGLEGGHWSGGGGGFGYGYGYGDGSGEGSGFGDGNGSGWGSGKNGWSEAVTEYREDL